MRESLSVSLEVIQESGMLAPLAFILLHLFRQFLFIPVGLVCIIGGLVFGAILGTIYSLVGIIITSILFYFAALKLPNLFQKVMQLKEKWFGNKMPLSLGQITILRLIPFVHFHLLSFCLIEISGTFKEYVRFSLFTVTPLVVLYTAFGNWIDRLPLQSIAIIILFLAILFYLLRRKEWILKWEEFFTAAKHPQG